MAKGQSGVNAITVWMIIFVALWLTSTVFLVILYTGQQDLVSENERLRAAKAKLISPREESSIELVRSASAGGPTVVGLLEQARSQTAEAATGNATDDPASVRGQLDQLLDSFRIERLLDRPESYQGLSYREALARLYDAYRTMHQKWQTSRDNLLEAQAELVTVRESIEALREDYAKKNEELTEQLARIEGDHSAYRQERDKAVEEMAREYEQARTLNTEILTKARQDLQLCSERLTEAQARFASLREKLGGLMQGPEELATARQPDGRVLTAVPGDEVVYINLGRQHGLTLGLQFSVYSAETGIPADGVGKARIEVVSIFDSSAECQIIAVARNRVI